MEMVKSGRWDVMLGLRNPGPSRSSLKFLSFKKKKKSALPSWKPGICWMWHQNWTPSLPSLEDQPVELRPWDMSSVPSQASFQVLHRLGPSQNPCEPGGEWMAGCPSKARLSDLPTRPCPGSSALRGQVLYKFKAELLPE